ncbi:hypothetical protein MASR2M66_13490 [Chloroflexota bacterium]
METNTPIYPAAPTNRHSIISFILGLLTLLLFCGSWVPIPFTGFICYPTSFISGLLALIYGGISLNSIRRNNESGNVMAWAGILSGGFILLCMLCMVILIASLFYFAPDAVQPFIDFRQI